MTQARWAARRGLVVLVLAALLVEAFVWGYAARGCQSTFDPAAGLYYSGVFFFIAFLFPPGWIAAAAIFVGGGFIRISGGCTSWLRIASFGIGVAVVLFVFASLLAGQGHAGACDLHFGF